MLMAKLSEVTEAMLVFTLIAFAIIGTCAVAQKNTTDQGTLLMIPGVMAFSGVMVSGDDGFIEIANGLNENNNLRDWNIIIDGTQVTLPEYALDPDQRVRVHLNGGNMNGRGLFLDNATESNDTVGDIILRDDAGNGAAPLGYKVEPDGPATYTMTNADDKKAVTKETVSGDFVTKKTSEDGMVRHKTSLWSR